MGGSGRDAVSAWSDKHVFQRGGQTCPAAFVRSRAVSASRARRWRSQSADGGEDGAHHRAGDSHLGHLEGDGTGVADNAGTDLDQLELQARQTPIGHGLG